MVGCGGRDSGAAGIYADSGAGRTEFLDEIVAVLAGASQVVAAVFACQRAMGRAETGGMLEDDFRYVLRKALVSRGIAPEEAAARAGVANAEVFGMLDGHFSETVARRLAPVLGLREQAFAMHPSYHPRPLGLPGVERLDLPFGGEQVNAWLVRAGGMVLLFDAGFEPADLAKALAFRGVSCPDRVFITHSHRDHVGALKQLLGQGVPVHSAGLPGTVEMRPGGAVLCGPLTVRAFDLSGHAVPALGFCIDGLAGPALVTGDALFAGSIGGCGSAEIYGRALGLLRETLAVWPDETVILPGHGPATTLGEERVANPFL
jgi:glyoxylase-like metal-dependent hydrolase (beta-lactamase superfamily II)